MQQQKLKTSRFGFIVTDKNDKNLQFVEKPKKFVGDRINTGLYIYSNKFLNRIKAKPTSIEREIFPKMASDQGIICISYERFLC